MEAQYMLIERIYDGDSYHNPRILGVFTNMLAVERFIQTSTDYELPDGKKPKFVSCRQLIEFPVGDTRYQLELTSIPLNPYNRIGELADQFADEPSFLEHENNFQAQSSFLAHLKNGISVHLWFGKDRLDLQFWGWAIVLLEDGTWFWEATDGG